MTRFKLNNTNAPQVEQTEPAESQTESLVEQSATIPSESSEGNHSYHIVLPVACRQQAWFLNNDRRPEQARVDRIEITHIAKPNVYGNECDWNERIVYYVGRCTRLSTEVFATKEDLIASLMKD